MMLEELREQVWKGNLALPANGLVAWTGGNLSAITADRELIVIKPSGMLYTDMTPADMVVVDSTGRVVDGDRGPVLRHGLPPGHLRGQGGCRIGGAHPLPLRHCLRRGRQTHPVLPDRHRRRVRRPVPCGGYAQIGSDAIGRELLAAIGDSPAVLMRQHGVFTIGSTINKALQAAVMVEDVAHTVFAAMQLGQIEELPAAEIAANHDRYTNRYGTINASTGVSR